MTTRESKLEQRVVSVLFYGVMLLVTATCSIELFRISQGADSGWAGAYGSWFGGAGSFAAVVAALAIAGWQKRSQDRITEASNLRREKIILYQIRRHFTNASMALGPLLQDDYTIFFKIHAFRDQPALLRSAFFPDLLQIPKLPLDELIYVDPISLKVAEMYERLEAHRRHIEILCKTKDEEVFEKTMYSMKANVETMRKTSILIAKYAKKRLNIVGVKLFG